jgi:phage tail sheath protein FI
LPITPTYPGVYIEEIPSGVRTIVGVATSITAFIGRAIKGPVNEPVRIQSFADFERTFGGLWVHSTMSSAVQHYFLNGGVDAIIVRVVHDDDGDPANNAGKASVDLAGADGPLELEASSEGNWGNSLRVRVDYDTRDPKPGESADAIFNLSIKDMGTGAVESFRNVFTDTNHARFVTKVLEQESTLVRVEEGSTVQDTRPTAHADPPPGDDPFETTGCYDEMTGGLDGIVITDTNIIGSESSKTGLYALEDADLFNLMCIPPRTRDQDIGSSTLSAALAYCKKRRAMLLVDPPSSWNNTADAVSGVDTLNLRDENAALFFPRVNIPDPLKENRLEEFAPCGAVAGIFARTDGQRGVWKAPAGQEATLTGVASLSYKLTDGENGQLNPLGVNCLRNFPVIGNIVWGSRTLEGADRLASEWKYIPVRRLALFLEESLFRGTKWVVFEPNDEPLWAQIRLNIGAFMHGLFRQGAFQGSTPKEAYFVKCDSETTTQADINLGIVNIVVGFAPLKPAEFVIIKIQQIAGQIQA